MRWHLPTQQQVADWLGVTRSAVARWKMLGMPGHDGEYNLQAIVRWLRECGPWQPKQFTGEDAALEALTKYRRWKGRLARLDFLQRQGNLLDRETVTQCLQLAGQAIRACGDELQRLGQAEAYDMLSAAIEQFSLECQALFTPAKDGIAATEPNHREAKDAPSAPLPASPSKEKATPGSKAKPKLSTSSNRPSA